MQLTFCIAELASLHTDCETHCMCKQPLQRMAVHVQGWPEGTVQVQLTLLAQEAMGQPELAATSDARLQAAFGQAGKGDIVQTGDTSLSPCLLPACLPPKPRPVECMPVHYLA